MEKLQSNIYLALLYAFLFHWALPSLYFLLALLRQNEQTCPLRASECACVICDCVCVAITIAFSWLCRVYACLSSGPWMPAPSARLYCMHVYVWVLSHGRVRYGHKSLMECALIQDKYLVRRSHKQTDDPKLRTHHQYGGKPWAEVERERERTRHWRTSRQQQEGDCLLLGRNLRTAQREFNTENNRNKAEFRQTIIPVHHIIDIYIAHITNTKFVIQISYLLCWSHLLVSLWPPPVVGAVMQVWTPAHRMAPPKIESGITEKNIEKQKFKANIHTGAWCSVLCYCCMRFHDNDER